MDTYPRIIQGGMGIGVSHWRLARSVAAQGGLGVVSGTGIGLVLARRLQSGDADGTMRHALAHFPVPAIAQRVIAAYLLSGGKPVGKPFKSVPMFTLHPRRALLELVLCANFAEVWLAKEGHIGPVGINLLEKVQLPHLVSLYGAMLAGVDYVLVGAGIPMQMPPILDALAHHAPVTYRLDVSDAGPDDHYVMTFDPRSFVPEDTAALKRPDFLAIVASATLAKMLVTKSASPVNGVIVEGPMAGGHNAPPRGKMQLNEHGEPIYGPRDAVDIAMLRELGVPFWLAGAYAHPHKLQEALALGAAGIQVGSIFALCDESGMRANLKHELRHLGYMGELSTFTDPLASPTGYPFKVAQLAETLAEPAAYAQRPRQCDIGRLRELYRRPDGAIGYRCPAEPVDAYQKKGGQLAETAGRKCLCNALMANIGFPQMQPNRYQEVPLVTMGDENSFLTDLMPSADASYAAADVLQYLQQAVSSR